MVIKQIKAKTQVDGETSESSTIYDIGADAANISYDDADNPTLVDKIESIEEEISEINNTVSSITNSTLPSYLNFSKGTQISTSTDITTLDAGFYILPQDVAVDSTATDDSENNLARSLLISDSTYVSTASPAPVLIFAVSDTQKAIVIFTLNGVYFKLVDTSGTSSSSWKVFGGTN